MTLLTVTRVKHRDRSQRWRLGGEGREEPGQPGGPLVVSEDFDHEVGLAQPGRKEVMAAALLSEVPRGVFGIEASSRTGDNVDDIVAVRCSGAHEDATQPESRIRVDSVTHWVGDLRQPGGHQPEHTLRSHP